MENLPDNVIEEILIRIPIRDAVRTSAVSPSWRHHWRSIPDLHFDDDIPVAAIDNVLLSHSPAAPIRSFSVASSAMTVADTDSWLLNLSHHHQSCIFHLQLRFLGQQQLHPLDSSLYSFVSLKALVLTNCSIPPISSNLFPLLEAVSFNKVHFPHENFIQDFIFNSPNLELLSLVHVTPSPLDLVVPNPQLRNFYFLTGYRCNSITFVAATKTLVDVNIVLYKDSPQFDLARSFPAGAECNGNLWFCNLTPDYLVKRRIPKSIPGCFQNLTVLDIQVNFAIKEQIILLFCLIRSAPNLKNIFIRGGVHKSRLPKHFWKQHAACQLDNLLTLEINLYSFLQAQIDFMVHVLERAKLLQKVIIVNSSESATVSNSTLRMLRNHRRASREAKIIYKVP